MNIQKINSTPVQNTSFTSLKKGCIPDYVFAGIKDAPALKNADIFVIVGFGGYR